MQQDPRWSRAALLVNARSRSGERAYREALEALRSLGVPVEHAQALQDPAALHDAVEGALAEEPDLLILGGGDGSVSAVVDLLGGGDTALGLLPLGTANDFARTLGIPSDVRAACEVIAGGKVVDIDLGLAGKDRYVNVASVGLSVEVTRRLSPGLKRRAGVLAYPIAALRALFGTVPFEARLRFPEGDHPDVEFERVLQVAVGNGRYYGGGQVVAPEAGIDDRSLDVYAIEPGPPRSLLGVLRLLRSGRFLKLDGVHHYRTRAVRVETEPTLSVNVDGELHEGADTPLLFGLEPNALHVVVPEESGAARLDTSGVGESRVSP